MNQIKIFIQQKNIVINNLSLNFNDIKDIKEKTKLINFKNLKLQYEIEHSVNP